MRRVCFLDGSPLYQVCPGKSFKRSLPVGCRHTGKRLESISHTSNSGNSSKTTSHTPVTALKRRLRLLAIPLAYCRKRLDQIHQSWLCDVSDPSACVLDGLILFKTDPIYFSRYHRGGSKPEVLFQWGPWCCGHVFSMDCLIWKWFELSEHSTTGFHQTAWCAIIGKIMKIIEISHVFPTILI